MADVGGAKKPVRKTGLKKTKTKRVVKKTVPESADERVAFGVTKKLHGYVPHVIVINGTDIVIKEYGTPDLKTFALDAMFRLIYKYVDDGMKVKIEGDVH